jgi:hypothetical protein
MNTIRSAFDFKTKLFGNLETQEFRSSGVQEFRSSGVQEFRRCVKNDSSQVKDAFRIPFSNLTAPRF